MSTSHQAERVYYCTGQVMIIGPPDTLYEGGFFKCHLLFPRDYPLKPPVLKFLTDIWHPNIEKDGKVNSSSTCRIILVWLSPARIEPVLCGP